MEMDARHGQEIAATRLMGMVLGAVVVAASLTGLAACGDDCRPASSGPVTLRLGYFPNLTHATAIVGVDKGFFAEQARRRTSSSTRRRSTPAGGGRGAARPARIDATYIGPNPAINAWAQSKGKGVTIVAGAASGGVFFVVKPEITTARGPEGQDDRHPAAGQHPGRGAALLAQAARATTTKEGGGDVKIKPQDNAETVDDVQVPAPSTAPGCPSRTPRSWSPRAARCSSTSGTCGRTASSSSPTCW